MIKRIIVILFTFTILVGCGLQESEQLLVTDELAGKDEGLLVFKPFNELERFLIDVDEAKEEREQPHSTEVAREKSHDMMSQNYFSHNSPTYGSPFEMMNTFGLVYHSAGENIALGQTTPEQVVEAWMNSDGHRENILDQSFTHVGVGYVSDGHYWTQQFIGR